MSATQVPIYCTLAKHHEGAHDEHGVPGRRACGALIRYHEQPAEEPCPPVEPFDPDAHAAAMEERREVERLPHDIAADPEPLPPPTLADLVTGVIKSDAERAAAADAVGEAEVQHGGACRMYAACCSLVAKHVGRGAIVSIEGALYRSVPPRKPRGGEVPPDALWTLEPVKVAT